MQALLATQLKSLLVDQTQFTGGIGHYYSAKKDFLRLSSEHEFVNKKLLKSTDEDKKIIMIRMKPSPATLFEC
jgi:hypothetical protein